MLILNFVMAIHGLDYILRRASFGVMIWPVLFGGAFPPVLAQPIPAASDLDAASQGSAASTIAESDRFSQSSGDIQQRGDRITLNGIALSVPWVQWQSQGREVFGISDVALKTLGGLDFLNTSDSSYQPVSWRETPLQKDSQQLDLPALLTDQVRYLDLSPLETAARWRVNRVTDSDGGQTLKIQTRSILQISNLLLSRSLSHRFRPHDIQWSPGIRWRQQYVIQGGAAFPVTELRFRLGSRSDAVTLAPIWSADEDIAGLAPIGKTVAESQVAAAINGGFFNRNNKTPLGAIRQNDRWVSGPILNRGAIAWNNQGNVAMARLKLQETVFAIDPTRVGQAQAQRLVTEQNTVANDLAPQEAEFPLISLNSGYLKAGFSRYTQDWGTSYVPLTDNEVLIYVKDGQVIEQREAPFAGKGRFPIPQGNPLLTFVLVARSNRTGAAKLPVGSRLRLQQRISPSELQDYPHILGGGPLLIQGGELMLDAALEGFSQAFVNQRAPRSAAVAFANGEFALVTVHERVAGKGPTLEELAQLLQALGGQDAINLDGGSSTQLVLGGQMINRNPRNAALVHNGLGLSQ